MLRAYKYQLRPTEEQKVVFNKWLGSARFIYNLALETKIAAYQAGKNLSCFDLINQLPELKRANDWLYETPSDCLQKAISNLDSAYTNFFKGRGKFPVYKKKSGRPSASFPRAIKIDFKSSEVILPKVGRVSYNRDRQFKGSIRTSTLSKTPTGKYFISILVETGKENPKPKKVSEKTAIGIDLGLKHFAILSDGRKIDNPRFLQNSLKKLRVEQRSLARKTKGSKRRELQKTKLSKLYERVTNQRKDFQHKLSTEIVNQYDSIAIEDLNIAGMVKNGKISRHITDASWGEFVRQLKYKAEWKGKNIFQIGRFEPSSKTCICGHINSELKLSDREWTCKKCGTEHDRDILAANNIKRFGLKSQPSNRERKALA